MALFSRRQLQARLDRLAGMIESAPLQALAERLNLDTREALHAEWELVWLSGFAQAGRLAHEKKFPGGTRLPDIHFTNGLIEFIADITAVSDSGYDKQNPLDALRDAFDALNRKHGLTRGGFRLNFSSRVEKSGKRSQPRLILPPHHQVESFVKRNFGPFLAQVAANPEKADRHAAVIQGADTVSLEYDPAIRPSSYESGHLCYDIPYALCDNPVYRGLKEKRNQLYDSGFNGLRGIILCDGDCAALGRYPGLRNITGHSLEAIVQEFFRQHSSISFVVTAGVKTNGPHMAGRDRLPFDLRLFCHPSVSASDRLEIEQVVRTASRDLPKAIWTPETAIRILREGSPPQIDSPFSDWLQLGISHSMKSTEISLPASTVLALLSGEIDTATYQQAVKRHDINDRSALDHIADALRCGQKLESITFQPGTPDSDDDTVVVRLSGTDSARAKFKAKTPTLPS